MLSDCNIRGSDLQGNSGIPFLKDIPLIGTLASAQANMRERTGLLVLVTPHVVRDQRDARALDRRSPQPADQCRLGSAGTATEGTARVAEPEWVLRMLRRTRLRLRDHERGFALLVVLWTLVLIAFVIAQVGASGRIETRIASNLAANAGAQAAADGAIYEAIFHLADPQPDRRWLIDGKIRELVIGDAQITLMIEDEANWINPNLASLTLLSGLLRAVGADSEQAADLARAIAEWVGTGEAAQPSAESVARYQAVGLDYGPPGAALESIDEICRVRGMTAELCSSLRPHLTLFGPAEPNRATADPIVAAALALSADSPLALPDAPPANPKEVVTVRIHARADGPGSARVGRIAVVRIGPSTPQRYTPLLWENEAE
jgi:general secretion pathway protein K